MDLSEVAEKSLPSAENLCTASVSVRKLPVDFDICNEQLS